MLTTKRIITDDDRQGGYTTTVSRSAPVFNFDDRRAPRADLTEYTEYERDRLEAMRMRAPAGSRTEAPFTERTVRQSPVPRQSPAPRRAYSEEDLMPSIRTMETVKTGRAGQSATARKTERTEKQSASAAQTGRKPLSQNAKLLIAVYAVIVFIALVLIIATGVAANKRADENADLENKIGAAQTEVTALNETIAYYTPSPASEDYEPVNDADVKTFAVIPLGEKTEYKEQTNWFDKICDFFSRLAGN